MKRLLLLLMLVSQPAWAEWVKIGESVGDRNAFTHFFDPATMRKTPDGRRVWMMRVYAQVQKDSVGTYTSTSTQYEFDCAGERSRLLQATWYSGPASSKEVVATLNRVGDWKFSAPGSIGETQLKVVCAMPLK